jgi:hypothetical protein
MELRTYQFLARLADAPIVDSKTLNRDDSHAKGAPERLWVTMEPLMSSWAASREPNSHLDPGAPRTAQQAPLQ